MRIQVKIGDEAPQTYTINKDTMVIGSSKTADIMIALPEISRKHVLLTKEGDTYYITDYGSTNGTFMSDMKLEPHKKTKFTSYFPFRMAQQVNVSLIDEDSTNTSATTIAPKAALAQAAKGRETTKTELILDLPKPKEKPKKAIPVPKEPEIEEGGGMVKGIIAVVVLAAIAFYVYQTFK